MTRREALGWSLSAPFAVRTVFGAQAHKAAVRKRALVAAIPDGPVRWTPHPVFIGAPVLFRSKTYSGPATWLDKSIEFRPDDEGFSALAGVGLTRTPGYYPLKFGDETVPVPVASHVYPSSTITVPQKFVEPPKDVQEQIAAEAAMKKQVFRASPADRLWQGAFTPPANSRFTSSFGVRRVYNGKTRSVHQGLDYSAAMGTPVHASNAGHVAIARDMYYEGGLVVIDHGESIFTLYMHLSEFLVGEGSAVGKGDVIAKSGSSGRATGPHLHFAVQCQGIYVEPSTLLRLWR